MKPKLLAPAGNFTALRAAIDAGCDEVYFGIRGFNMRANANNFAVTDLKRIANLCHKKNVKANLALNTIIYNNELHKVKRIIAAAKRAQIDAIIAWDMAVIQECINNKINVHLSTQNAISNSEALKCYKKMIPNLKRVVLARETKVADIKKIIKASDVQIETFVHGAMCVSVSGRCFMSQELFNRSANRGDCIQPCRREYEITDVDEKYKLTLGRDYVLSPKDLCTLPFIEKLIDVGIHSFKIEGRNRSPEYVSTVVAAYRKVIDVYCERKTKIKRNPKERKAFETLKHEQIANVKKVYNRDFSAGFYMGVPLEQWCNVAGSKATTRKAYAGKVTNYFPKVGVAEVLLESETIKKGSTIMFQGTTTGVYELTAEQMQIDGKYVAKAEKKQRVGIKVQKRVRRNDQLYVIKKV